MQGNIWDSRGATTIKQMPISAVGTPGITPHKQSAFSKMAGQGIAALVKQYMGGGKMPWEDEAPTATVWDSETGTWAKNADGTNKQVVNERLKVSDEGAAADGAADLAALNKDIAHLESLPPGLGRDNALQALQKKRDFGQTQLDERSKRGGVLDGNLSDLNPFKKDPKSIWTGYSNKDAMLALKDPTGATLATPTKTTTVVDETPVVVPGEVVANPGQTQFGQWWTEFGNSQEQAIGKIINDFSQPGGFNDLKNLPNYKPEFLMTDAELTVKNKLDEAKSWANKDGRSYFTNNPAEILEFQKDPVGWYYSKGPGKDSKKDYSQYSIWGN